MGFAVDAPVPGGRGFCEGIAMEELLAHPTVCIGYIAEKLELAVDRESSRLPRPTRTITEGRIHRLVSRRPESTAIVLPRQRAHRLAPLFLTRRPRILRQGIPRLAYQTRL